MSGLVCGSAGRAGASIKITLHRITRWGVMQKLLQFFPYGGGRIRFDKESVGAELPDPVLGLRSPVSTDNNDGNRGGGRRGANPLDQLESVHARHMQVGDDGRDRPLFDKTPGLP